MPEKFLAAVLIRSAVSGEADVLRTLRQLHLSRKNVCAVVPDSPSLRAMLKRLDRLTTWGEVSQDVVDKLKPRRIADGVFALHPPRGGFERKGIKMPFKAGGALGYRGSMNEILGRMM